MDGKIRQVVIKAIMQEGMLHLGMDDNGHE